MPTVFQKEHIMQVNELDVTNCNIGPGVESELFDYNSIKLVRTIKIDPNTRTIAVRTINNLYEEISEELGDTAILRHHLPNKNRLYAVIQKGNGPSFSIGR